MRKDHRPERAHPAPGGYRPRIVDCARAGGFLRSRTVSWECLLLPAGQKRHPAFTRKKNKDPMTRSEQIPSSLSLSNDPTAQRVSVGVDVSKDTLDTCLPRQVGKPLWLQTKNDASGFAKLLRWATYQAQAHCAREGGTVVLHFCLEATGSSSTGLATFLVEANQCVSVVNPFLIKHHGMAMGVLNKNDK